MTPAPALREARSLEDYAIARELFVEYAQWLAVDLCFQGFEQELATLPGVYAPPRGRLLLAGTHGAGHGCVALRPIEGEAPRERSAIGEVKRLYVRPAQRKEGWGRRLAEAVIADARAIGYAELKLDTLEWMTDARKLYASLGFRECAPYYVNPLPGVIYMSRGL